MYILQPCVTLSTLLSSERYSCAVNLGLFLFFSMFFFSFLLGSLGCVVFFSVPSPTLLLFMKLENLKDCCVFVNNKTVVHSVLVTVRRPNCDFWSPSPARMWSGVDVPPPHPGVNVGDQTLFSGRAQVTLTPQRHRHQGKVHSPQRLASLAKGPSLGSVCQRPNRLFFTACQFLNCVAVSFFTGGIKENCSA